MSKHRIVSGLGSVLLHLFGLLKLTYIIKGMVIQVKRKGRGRTIGKSCLRVYKRSGQEEE